MPLVLTGCSTGVVILRSSSSRVRAECWVLNDRTQHSALSTQHSPLRPPSSACKLARSESDAALILFRGERPDRGGPAGAFGAARGGFAERPDVGRELDDLRLTDLALEARHDRI